MLTKETEQIQRYYKLAKYYLEAAQEVFQSRTASVKDQQYAKFCLKTAEYYLEKIAIFKEIWEGIKGLGELAWDIVSWPGRALLALFQKSNISWYLFSIGLGVLITTIPAAGVPLAWAILGKVGIAALVQYFMISGVNFRYYILDELNKDLPEGKKLTEEDLEGLTWQDWMKIHRDKPELYQWLHKELGTDTDLQKKLPQAIQTITKENPLVQKEIEANAPQAVVKAPEKVQAIFVKTFLEKSPEFREEVKKVKEQEDISQKKTVKMPPLADRELSKT